ncbi:hypothetical protein HETIRDRAFT_104008 [Heterobasidion irregulare TC 32-1]|uniref:Uncharacterized protein n=1 Tax=Heterobasidion irregulare (strain TC 32-1) TaxID=747525 RepID=W4JZV9_HETIT|nr:uncharacterized protein HETIRDRAFT_104008 [Heterobasidion irregulare TC 32-1]ETW78625.1 hypothetical protein HETIRDRAFT_104008 [Heterobasidion irregulare TC 32-1]
MVGVVFVTVFLVVPSSPSRVIALAAQTMQGQSGASGSGEHPQYEELLYYTPLIQQPTIAAVPSPVFHGTYEASLVIAAVTGSMDVVAPSRKWKKEREVRLSPAPYAMRSAGARTSPERDSGYSREGLGTGRPESVEPVRVFLKKIRDDWPAATREASTTRETPEWTDTPRGRKFRTPSVPGPALPAPNSPQRQTVAR